VINRLKTIPSVYSVVPFGGYRRQLQVIVDRNRLAAHRLSILDVRNAIDPFNVSRPGGTLPSTPGERIVPVDSRATRPQDVLNYPISSVGGGDGATGGREDAATGGGAGGGMGGGMGAGGAVPPSPRLPFPSSEAVPTPNAGIIYVRDVARVIDGY